MASELDGDSLEPIDFNTIDELVTQHRKERKELQAQIQKLKHGIPKGDKKKKKEVTEQVAKLETELDARQEKELADFRDRKKGGQALNNSQQTEPESQNSQQNMTKKSKAQRRRDKKQEAEVDREDRIKAQEVENRLGPRHREMVRIKEVLKERRIALHEIPADGDCLYSAISHQLSAHDKQFSVKDLRDKTSSYLRSHKDDFLPFLTHPDTGDVLTDEEFEAYCDKTADSSVWGGQIELRAMSEVLEIPIQVLQAEAEPLIIGDETRGEPLVVVYHRHMYRLGEHYNSTAPIPEADKESEASP